MSNMVYKVVPAPARGTRAKGAKGVDGRFANAMQVVLNEMAADGWMYLRAETLPSQDRVGMTRRIVESYQNVLVFGKEAEGNSADVEANAPEAPKRTQMAPMMAPLPVEPSLVSEPEIEPDDYTDTVEEMAEEAVEDAVNEAKD